MTLAKVIADIVLFDPPFLATFFFTTHLLTGHTLSQTWRKMKQDVVPTYWIDIQVWTPMQIINFRYVSVRDF